MTMHDRDTVIAAAKASQLAYQSDVMLSLEELEAFYAIAHEAGRASRDAEVALLNRVAYILDPNSLPPYSEILECRKDIDMVLIAMEPGSMK